jgi:hypothetical protein
MAGEYQQNINLSLCMADQHTRQSHRNESHHRFLCRNHPPDDVRMLSAASPPRRPCQWEPWAPALAVPDIVKPRLTLSSDGGGLLDLPADVLRYRILAHGELDSSSLGVCRFVCRNLRDLLPRKMFPPGRWLLRTEIPLPLLEVIAGGCLVRGAVVHGRTNVLKWALQQGAPLNKWSDQHLLNLAAAAGQLQVLQWLLKETTCTPYVCTLYHETSRQYCWAHAYELAIAYCQLHVAKWLLPFVGALEREDRSLIRLCEVGHMEMLRWQQERLPFTEAEVGDLVTEAATFGSLDVLQWLQHTSPAFFTAGLVAHSEYVRHGAVASGNLEIVPWLHACGAEVTLDVVALFAMQNQLGLLKWARKIGAPWNDEHVMLTAGFYSLDCLKYLLAEGVPWPWNFFERAIKTFYPYRWVHRKVDSFPPLEFARRNGVEWNDAAMAALAAACRWSRMRRWILANLKGRPR